MPSPSRALATLALVALSACCGLAKGADTDVAPIGVVTIAEGEASLVRGTAKFATAEGVRVGAGDIVETGTAARLLRIEFDDGKVLNLGPGTRLMLAPRLADKARAEARLYLVQGWIKTDLPVASPLIDLRQAAGPVVLALLPEGVQAFSESGTALLQERRPGAAPLPLKPGEYFQHLGDGKPAVAPRPAPAFLEHIPRPFLDTLPARAGLFKQRQVSPKPLGAASYAELQPWIDGEPALRRPLQSRWMPLLREPEFRKALAAGLPRHPEWERVLFPERFKPASAASR